MLAGSVMLRDLAIEVAVLAGLAFCFFLFVPTARLSFNSRVVPILFFCVVGFLGLAVFQLKRLFDGGKKKHPIAFTIILIVTMIVIFAIAWILSEPRPMDWLV
jgi:heme/copper-type cytochrome/quinol oxidase subunit 4